MRLSSLFAVVSSAALLSVSPEDRPKAPVVDPVAAAGLPQLKKSLMLKRDSSLNKSFALTLDSDVFITGQTDMRYIRILSFEYKMRAYAAYCAENYVACSYKAMLPSTVTMTDEIRTKLDKVNKDVNAMIEYTSDQENYGMIDKYAIPVSVNGEKPKGDCEDYALTKRKILLESIPASAMMLAFVRYGINQQHAILLVRTDEGDYMLDNRSENVLPVRDTTYDFIAVTDPVDYSKWRMASFVDPEVVGQVVGARSSGYKSFYSQSLSSAFKIQ